MNAGAAFLQELEQAVSRGTSARRVEMLRLVTDLFLAGAAEFSDEQLDIFDDVIGRLADDIEVNARIEMSQRLAPAPQAPANIARALALDDDIAVAEPMLSQASYLDDSVLAESAQSKSQDHLLAISRRKSLSEPLTDILVTRGDHKVVRSVAGNDGARFSERGFETIVRRSEGDDDLAQTVGLRRDIPPDVFNALVAKASHRVRMKLMEANPDAAAQVSQAVTDAAVRLEAQALPHALDYSAAERRLGMLHQTQLLDQAEIDACARNGSFEEVVVGLSLLCGIPINVVEQTFRKEQSELFMIILKAAGLKWPTVKTILGLRFKQTGFAESEHENFAMFDGLQTATAQRVLRFYHTRTMID